jgi:uncharacterized protein YifN (PemK superfamily)
VRVMARQKTVVVGKDQNNQISVLPLHRFTDHNDVRSSAHFGLKSDVVLTSELCQEETNGIAAEYVGRAACHGLDGSQMPESSTPASVPALKQQKILRNQITSILVVC